MDHLKKVKYLLPSEMIDMGGLPVKQPLPTQNVEQVDPFLLLHHGAIKPLKNRPANDQGVGPHPHRGFSPVSFVIEGAIHHRDSRGNNQIARAGEVQWMHAGMGIIHSERPPKELVEKMGRQEMIQLWINSPGASKMKEPSYQFLSEKDMPIISSEDKKINNKLVAGIYEGERGKAQTQSPLLIIWGKSENGGKQIMKIPSGFNSMIFLIKGKMTIDGYGIVGAENLLVFSDEGENISLSFQEDSQFLLLCGEPINEELAQHGPFVMNNQTEILEAMRDYQMGKMGFLVEEDL